LYSYSEHIEERTTFRYKFPKEFICARRKPKKPGYASAPTFGRPRMLLRLMHPCASSCFFFEYTPPAAVVPHLLLLLRPTPPPARPTACERQGTQHAYPNARESTACVPQCERNPSFIREGARNPMRERAQHVCPNVRGREGAQRACTYIKSAACSTKGTMLGGAACDCPRVRARGEHHLLQRTETR
jgi:hypothetical protein